MRENQEPITDLGMSSFIRYRRLQMPRMGNANFKRDKIRTEREILDRLFPNWGVYHSNKPSSIKNSKKVIESESDRDSLGGCTSSSDESTRSMSHNRRLDHPPSSENDEESGSNSDSAMDPGSSSDSEKTSDEGNLNSLSETISRISISSVDSAIDDKFNDGSKELKSKLNTPKNFRKVLFVCNL